MPLYNIFNGAMPTTAALVKVTTGTAIKTLLQLKPFNEIGRASCRERVYVLV